MIETLAKPDAPRWSASTSTSGQSAREARPAWLSIPDRVVDGGEIVLLAVKPSLWRPLFDAAPALLGSATLAAVVSFLDLRLPGLSLSATVQVAVVLGAIVLGVSILRWIVTWYLVTNRRVLDVQGVWAPRIWSCPLIEVRNTYVNASAGETVVGLGTITFVTQRPHEPPRLWRSVAKSVEVHTDIRRAIENAIDHHGASV